MAGGVQGTAWSGRVTWLKIADEFLEDETVVALSDRAYRLHVSVMVYCSRNLTDGLVTGKQLKVIQAILGFQVKRYVAELVASGLWLETDDGSYEVKNFLKYNPSSADVKKQRERNAERQRRHRDSNAVTNTVSHAAPSRPDPKEKEPLAVTRPEATAPEQKKLKSITPDFKEVA